MTESEEGSGYEGTTGVTIPVNVRIEGKHKVLDLGELEKVLRNAKVISQGVCGCRKERGDDACMEPMDGCFGIDEFAKDAIDNHGEKEVSLEDALAAMERTYDAGLVHMVYTFKGNDQPNIVCSCCNCCCEFLIEAAKVGYSDQIFESKNISTHNSELCNDCGICVDRCQFGARTLVDGTLVYDEGRCFGCGLCVKPCPIDGTITMVERKG